MSLRDHDPETIDATYSCCMICTCGYEVNAATLGGGAGKAFDRHRSEQAGEQ